MAEIEQERISIKRPKDSIDGRVIEYLRSNPLALDMDYSQVVTSTLRKHWLPIALLSSGVSGEELRQIGIWAIGQLEAQISMIRRICGIAPDPIVVTSNVVTPTTVGSLDNASILGAVFAEQQIDSSEQDDDGSSYEESEDPDDDELIKLEKPEEMIRINRMLGWKI